MRYRYLELSNYLDIFLVKNLVACLCILYICLNKNDKNKNNKNQITMTALEFNKQLINLEDKLERFAYSLTSNHEEAKDLLQETYYKALANRDKFIGHSNLKAWTFTIMKNTFINNYRKKQKQNTHNDQTDNNYFINQSEDKSPIEPDSEYAIIEINKSIEELSDEFRIPFKMFLSGYKYKEIADHLDLKIGTVKSRIFFTRKKLSEKLKGYSSFN
jgi:RNA polymerase sigma-70 factor (ECF subfamily)